MTIRDLQRAVFDNSLAHGFWPSDKVWLDQVDQKLLLVVSEIAEAQNELRDNVDPTYTYKRADGKPEGFQFELADAVIRILDLAQALNIDLQSAIELKHAFNVTRPFKHGRRF